MLQLSNHVALEPVHSALLNEWQQTVSSVDVFAAKVNSAKSTFSNKNKKTNPTFKHVRERLDEQCHGARRCGYCEDSMADEVEHIWPKNFYPDRVFDWSNYLYACGPCNGPKNNQFAIQVAANELHLNLDPLYKTEPPPDGTPLLIDPRNEPSHDYFLLDLITFAFKPKPNLQPFETIRAEYTIKVLNLNSRDALLKAREIAFSNYCARLSAYIRSRDNGLPLEKLDQIKQNLLSEGHPFVWFEMKRAFTTNSIPKIHCSLKDDFNLAPETLSWNH
jgi:uncharacterized protein (TIGR02646 family)